MATHMLLCAYLQVCKCKSIIFLVGMINKQNYALLIECKNLPCKNRRSYHFLREYLIPLNMLFMFTIMSKIAILSTIICYLDLTIFLIRYLHLQY